ncbi:phospholipase DDHD1, partial [Silurus meridionalis]
MVPYRESNPGRSEQERIPVMRAQWFTDGTWLPLDEEDGDLIEVEHLTKFRGHRIEDSIETEGVITAPESKEVFLTVDIFSTQLYRDKVFIHLECRNLVSLSLFIICLSIMRDPVVTVIFSSGPKTDPCGTPNLSPRECGELTIYINKLKAISQIRPEPGESCSLYSNNVLQSSKQEMMINGVKSCTEVEQN